MARDLQSVLFLPNWAKANPYQALLAKALRERGFKVGLCDFPPGRLPLFRLARQRRDLGILHLHWIDPWIAPLFWSANPVKRLAKRMLLTIDLSLCRLLGVRTFWTIHNFVSHESPDADWELRIRRLVAQRVGKCFVHSRSALAFLEHGYDVSLTAKTTVVPHASYVGQYSAAAPAAVTTLRHAMGLSGGEFVYLFIGSIRRYKGIETLIEAFRSLPDSDARLLIAGATLDPDFADLLRCRAAGDRRILLKTDYLADEDLPAYLDLASIVVLPFARTLTSGSALLAMSFAKPLILPETARIFDFPGEAGAVYFAQGHLNSALKAARQADLHAMAAFNRKEAEARSWSQMGAMIADAYTHKTGESLDEDSELDASA